MNVISMHDRIQFYCDKMLSPRFQSDFHYDQSLNIAQDKIIQDKYDNIKQHKMYGFQVVQKVRDDLRTIVKTVPLVPTGNLLAYPSDYLYELALAVTINGVEYSSTSTAYNRVNVLDENSFTQQTVEHPTHIEDVNGITVMFGTSGTFTAANLSYLSIAPPISKGLVNITASPTALTLGKTYYVTVGTVTVNSVNYSVGQEFLANVTTVMTGTGTVIEIANCVLPISCHEELCRYASSLLIGTVEGYPQSKFLKSEAESV